MASLLSMKIGINALFLNNTPTGVGIFTKEVCHGLCNTEDVVIYSPIDIANCHVKKTPISLSGSKNLTNNIKRLFYMNSILPIHIKKDRLDILYCPIAETSFLKTSIPLVITVHDLHPIYFKRQFGLSSLHFQITLTLLPKLASKITVPSHFVKGELIKHSKIASDNIYVVYNGYDKKHFKPMPEDEKIRFLSTYHIDRPYILFVGSLFKYKNLKVLIDAFLSIKNGIDHYLVVIGKREVATEGIIEDERIIYLDYVRHHDLPYFYSYADVFVHPALFEGFGLSVLEAMACGTVVIASTGGSLPEVVGDGGLLFDPKDSSTLSTLLLKVINDMDLRNEIVKKGIARAGQFSWERTVEGLINVFHKAL